MTKLGNAQRKGESLSCLKKPTKAMPTHSGNRMKTTRLSKGTDMKRQSTSK